MKKLAFAAAFAIAAASASAGGLDEPEMEQPVEEPTMAPPPVEEPTGRGLIIPLLLLLAVGVAVSN